MTALTKCRANGMHVHTHTEHTPKKVATAIAHLSSIGGLKTFVFIPDGHLRCHVQWQKESAVHALEKQAATHRNPRPHR